jgi:hypothetical protein
MGILGSSSRGLAAIDNCFRTDAVISADAYETPARDEYRASRE